MSIHTKKSDTHQERYIHLEVENHPKVHGATVFARETSPGHWTYIAAYCAHGDAFNRRLGRQIARRMFFNPAKHDRLFYPGGPFEYQKAVEVALTGLKNL